MHPLIVLLLAWGAVGLTHGLITLWDRQKSQQSEAQRHLFTSIDKDNDAQIQQAEIQQYLTELQDTGFTSEKECEEAAVLSTQTIDGQDVDSSISRYEFELYLSDIFQAFTVAEWVEHGLNMPQYADYFRQQGIMALDLPLLIEGGPELLQELKVHSPLDQKRMVPAMKRLVLGAGSPPSAPQNVTCTANPCGGIFVQWHPSEAQGQPRLHKYTVYRSETAAGQPTSTWTYVGEVLPQSGSPTSGHLAFHDPHPPRGRDYNYRVAAWNLLGSSVPAVVVGCTAPTWWQPVLRAWSFGGKFPTCAAPGAPAPLTAALPTPAGQSRTQASAARGSSPGRADSDVQPRQSAPIPRARADERHARDAHAASWVWTSISMAAAVLSLLVRVHKPTREVVLHVLSTTAHVVDALPGLTNATAVGTWGGRRESATREEDIVVDLRRQLSVIQEYREKRYGGELREQVSGLTEDGEDAVDPWSRGRSAGGLQHVYQVDMWGLGEGRLQSSTSSSYAPRNIERIGGGSRVEVVDGGSRFGSEVAGDSAARTGERRLTWNEALRQAPLPAQIRTAMSDGWLESAGRQHNAPEKLAARERVPCLGGSPLARHPDPRVKGLACITARFMPRAQSAVDLPPALQSKIHTAPLYLPSSLPQPIDSDNGSATSGPTNRSLRRGLPRSKTGRPPGRPATPIMRKTVSLVSLRDRLSPGRHTLVPQEGAGSDAGGSVQGQIGSGEEVELSASGDSFSVSRQVSMRAVMQDLSKCGQPGCTVTWQPPWQALLGPRRAKHYCSRCQHFYCIEHTAYSNHGEFGTCDRESACVCVDCFARLPESGQLKLLTTNTLKGRQAKQPGPGWRWSRLQSKAKRHDQPNCGARVGDGRQTAQLASR